MRVDRRLFLGLGAAALSVSLAAPLSAKVPVPLPRPALPVATVQDPAPVQVGATAPSGHSGWLVVDLDSGEVIDQSEPDRALAPASVAKLPTAAFALDALGHGHRFETRVLATGPVRGGRVDGALVLQGGGDPELDSDALETLARKVRAHGITAARGLLSDGSALPQASEITPEQEVHATYNPSVSGLNLNFNRVNVKWDARKGHELLSVEATGARRSPPVDVIRIAVANAPGAPLFSVKQQGGHEVWQMAREAYRGQATRWLPVKRPEAYAAAVFRTLAEEEGVRLGSAGAGADRPDGGEVLAVHQSRELGDILRDMLRYSTNLTAEVVGAGAARASGTAAQSLEDTAAAMNAWVAGVAGFPVGDPGFRMVNHSGLTLDSRVSPRRMVELLTALAEREPGAAGSLPGGIAGYLRGYDPGKGTPAGVRVAAKTGTMSYVRGLAGYVLTPEGRRLAFAIFSNDLDKRGAGPESVNRGWMGQAKAFERALIRSWVARADA